MTKTDDITFEEALKQLETTVREMEAGDLELDQLLGRFETGIGLLRCCEKKLGEAQEKIEVLTKKAIEAQEAPVAAKPEKTEDPSSPDSPVLDFEEEELPFA